jgi:hypothetical protein
MTRPKQAIALPGEDPTLGPAMRALPSDRMRDYVRLISTGSYTGAQAVEIAGYSTATKSTLHAKASDLNHDPRIQAALREECLKLIAGHGPMAIKVLRDIASDKTNAPRDRIKAATELLNRGGLSSVTKHDINVNVSLTEGEKDREIIALATELGLDQAATQKLLGYKPPIDADFVEIVDPEFPDIAPPAKPGNGPKIRKPELAKDRAEHRMRWRRQRTETSEERLARVERQNAEKQARSRERYIDARLSRGEITPEEAERQRAELAASRTVPVEISANEDDAWME